MEHAYGRSEVFTVGVEEELLLVDRTTHALAPIAEELIPALDLPEEAAGHEAYAAEIELRSPISDTAAQATDALRRGRDAARRAGATLMGSGAHPAAEYGDARLVDTERYRRAGEAMRGLLRRTPECALHVHVGMPDPDTAICAFNGLRVQLPLLVGLAANSPFWFGQDSLMASARSALVRAYPGRGVPPAFRDFAHYAETIEAVTEAGHLDDYTYLWWDLRPHPRLGTIELREMDAQSRPEDVAALSALVHVLAVEAVDIGQPAAPPPREAIAFSSFRAARDGLDSQILNSHDLRPLREIAEETLARVRPRAREIGDEDALEGIERILRDGGGADRQRRAHERGGMPALLAHLVDETATP